jgi:uncharacterized membrane protein YgaE (UPF0421/DUF939 family)
MRGQILGEFIALAYALVFFIMLGSFVWLWRIE